MQFVTKRKKHDLLRTEALIKCSWRYFWSGLPKLLLKLKTIFHSIEGDLTWDAEHTVQYTDDVLWNCTPDTYVILVTNVAPENSI